MSSVLTIVDTHIFGHLIAYHVEKGNNQAYIPYMTAGYAEYLANCLFMPDEYLREDHYTLFVGDSKPYWRNIPFRDIGVAYKANRRYTAGKNSELVEKILYHFDSSINQLNGAVLRINTHEGLGLEADDIASAVCRVKKPDTKVFLLTTDIDWLGLTQLPNVHWINARSDDKKHGRVRNNQNFVEWFNSWGESQSAIKKGFVAKSPNCIYTFKCRYGDRSDNIPAFSDDTSLDLISLLNPRFDITKYCDVMKMVKSRVVRVNPSLTHDAWQVKSKLFPLFPRIPLDNLSICQ